MTRVRTSTAAVVAALGGCLAGCDDEGVRTYRVPKEAAPASAATESPASEVVWSVPAGWKVSENNPTPRVATFRAESAGGAEISVTRFPGEAGGLAANINRWRGQLGLEVVPDGQAEAAAQRIVAGGIEIAVVRLAGGKGMDMVGAVVRPGDGQTWFVKVVGAPGDMDKVRPQVEEFVRSFRLAVKDAAASADATENRPGGVRARLAAWQAPANWKQEQDAMAMAFAVFGAESAAGKARVTLTVLDGEGGGPLSNINRWRGQLGLPPLAGLDDPSVTRTPEGALVVHLADAAGEKAMAGAIVSDGARTWFFKMTGPSAAVAAEREAFEGLVRAAAK